MYPEYCRKLIDNAPVGFDQAVFEWEQLYKPVQLSTTPLTSPCVLAVFRIPYSRSTAGHKFSRT